MKRVIILMLTILFVFSACDDNERDKRPDQQNPQATLEASEEPIESKNLFTKDTYPRVDGSTATIPLSEDIAAHLLGLSQKEVSSFIKHNKTHNAYVNLIVGNADIIFVTEPSDEELQLAKNNNIELEVIPVVKDAFVFLANVENPVESLTIKEIQDIYQGNITNWKEVGGEDTEIIAYQRPKNSGSQTSMENIVMNGLPMAEAPKEKVPAEMGELIDRVAGYDNSDKALGYSVFFFANSMYKMDTFKLLGVNGVKPDKETIRKDEYPFTSAYYAVINKSQSEDSPARKLLNFILSDEGQKIAGETGYVPVK